MNRLTYKEPNGAFGVAGMNAENQDAKLYACVCKLKDYEDIGLSPDQVEQLQYQRDDLLEEGKSLKAENNKLREALQITKEKL